ncbi:hypothetical protein [Streptomyces sp. NBC_00557]|uniref:hypothetical protein n=1 Tax=Streptomyces sp. NBC_00557 TaxID=2975776 RepID=UPI002E81A69A|nr:hypothetical protein [Streptomyces sp. NBC_00557]WUC36387.1 hypothetical protein OG956_20260 [Streptomyces sp. NBC_00557]
MARLQILELPSEPDSDAEGAYRTPFALILDQVAEEDAQTLRSMATRGDLNAFARACGARAIGVFEYTVDVG